MKKAAVIGFPVKHSWSPIIHNYWIKEHGIVGEYKKIEVHPSDLKSLVVSKSFGIVIPMNKGLSARKKKDRIEKYYEPYHKELSKFILKKQNQYKKIYLVSIHSFTKQGKLFNRGPSFGLLHGKNINLFLLLRKFLITKNVHFGCNYPYSGHFYNYTLDRASKQGITDNLCVEIRNDLICCKKGITYYSKILHDTFFRILNE